MGIFYCLRINVFNIYYELLACSGMFIIKLFKIKELKYLPQVKFLLYDRLYK